MPRRPLPPTARARRRRLARRTGTLAAGAALVASLLGVAGPGAPSAGAAAPSLAFDTCEAPSVDAMRAWKGTSPYSSVAVYIGGEMRACPNLVLDSPDWIRQVRAEGWGVIPVYVGPQAACSGYRVRMDPTDPQGHGEAVGRDTVARAAASGLEPGDPVYLDLEPWSGPNELCEGVGALFIDAWARRVRAAGYVPGLYSTPTTGIAVHREMAAHPGLRPVDLVWVASWNDRPGDAGSDPSWAGRWMHQYAGDHDEAWGGVTMSVDSNWVDAPVAGPTAG